MNFKIIKLSEVYPLELKNIFSNFIKEKNFYILNLKNGLIKFL